MADPLNLQTDVVRQHTVPRFLLKHFSAPGKGKRRRLHAFDKARGGSYATTPDDATVRNTFYKRHYGEYLMPHLVPVVKVE